MTLTPAPTELDVTHSPALTCAYSASSLGCRRQAARWLYNAEG